MSDPSLPDCYAMPVILVEPRYLAAWEDLQAEIETPSEDDFFASVSFVEEAGLSGRSESQLVTAFPRQYPEYPHAAIMIADEATFESEGSPLLAVSLNSQDASASFRIKARDLHSLENNLSIGNMGFDEFAARVDESGVFRGF